MEPLRRVEVDVEGGGWRVEADHRVKDRVWK